mmetsp:Transcript_25760/g.46650  ORF Transcript_25760/g.46650 Transcript_25760/m.46650 type:complete len:282 (+) Transcript_25760:190-1035(+)
MIPTMIPVPISTLKQMRDAAIKAIKSIEILLIGDPKNLTPLLAREIDLRVGFHWIVLNATTPMTPARDAYGIMPMRGAKNRTLSAITAVYTRTLVTPVPPLCKFKKVWGMSPHPPKPPKRADRAFPADMAIKDLFFTASASLVVSSVVPTASSTTLTARSVSRMEITAILNAAGATSCRVLTVRREESPPVKPTKDGSELYHDCSTPADEPIVNVDIGRCMTRASTVEATMAMSEQGHPFPGNNLGRKIVKTAVNAVIPPVAMSSSLGRSPTPSTARKMSS